ncbi:MAG: type II secretion system protein [Lachnospiraceae bacterium]|nr:type II secretion system protein [Lachnospiraceae bacterium]
MWKQLKKNNGYTLVELVVSMALTAILATAVASMMFPVMNIFMNMQKLSRAQMVADIVTDALRKECAAAYVTGVADVRLLDLPAPIDPAKGDDSLQDLLAVPAVQSGESGTVLVFRINEGYAKALYWNTGISAGDYNDVVATDTEPKMGDVTSRAVYRIFPDGVSGISESGLPQETAQGYLHCAYYETAVTTLSVGDKTVASFYPTQAYDYTNPFSAGMYNGFTISVEYSGLTFESIAEDSDSQADLRPVYVIANVKVYESGYEGQSEDTLLCSRNAVLCFAEDNVRP